MCVCVHVHVCARAKGGRPVCFPLKTKTCVLMCIKNISHYATIHNVYASVLMQNLKTETVGGFGRGCVRETSWNVAINPIIFWQGILC